MANENEADRLKADAKRAGRIALLARSWECDEATAARMVDATAGLTDEEFQAHANYLAERRASITQAAAKLPPQATGLPVPMGGHPTKVKTVDREALQKRVRADINEYLASEVFGLDDEPDADGPVAYFAAQDEAKASDPQGEGSLNRAVAEYLAAEVFKLE